MVPQIQIPNKVLLLPGGCWPGYDLHVKKLRLPARITNEKGVRDFFRYLTLVDNTSFHPDDDFKDYVTADRQGRTTVSYTKKAARTRNQLMAQSWSVVGDRVFDIALELMEAYGHASRGPKEWSPYQDGPA
jgi:hypothetical protein